MHKLGIIIISACIAACTSQPINIKAHTKDNLKKSDVALIKPVAYIEIHSIDGNKDFKFAPSRGLTIEDLEIELLPGEHEVIVSYYDGNKYSSGDVRLKFRVKKGRKYIIANKMHDDGWTPEFKDVTNKEECWTVKVGVWGGPSTSDC